jgi:L-alanine-DL-glutamate epimerase-like enolase superfamily enzyme
MKLIKINILYCDTPFKYPFHSPHIIRLRADSIIVELQFDNGISGYGESAPRSYVTGETQLTVTDMIKIYFAEILFQTEIMLFEDVKKTLTILEELCIDKNLNAYNSALAAVEIALLDALGRFQGVSIHHYLGANVREKISRSIPIPFMLDSTIRELYPMLKELELDSIKIIMGNVERNNIERVRLIRSLFGEVISIRVEANGKWSVNQAISHIENLKRFNISGVEQPVAASDIAGLKDVREKTGIPVIVDESMCNLSDAKRLIEEKACDIINIKISKCGGLIRSKEIKDFAESKNIPCQVGAHVGETDILGRAGHLLALTTKNLFCFEGFSYMLFEDSQGHHFPKQLCGKEIFKDPGLGVGLTNHGLKLLCSVLPADKKKRSGGVT